MLRRPLPVAEARLNDAERRAVAAYFDGDHGLFMAFKASSHPQFERDARAADAALRDAQPEVFRRVMHSLKSVFQLLGEDHLSGQARQLESETSHTELPELGTRWEAMKQAMRTQGLLSD